jgi:hypothetical protein
MPAQFGVRDADDQHAIGTREDDLVLPRAIAERKVARLQARFTTVLSVDAFPFHLQLQKEH